MQVPLPLHCFLPALTAQSVFLEAIGAGLGYFLCIKDVCTMRSNAQNTCAYFGPISLFIHLAYSVSYSYLRPCMFYSAFLFHVSIFPTSSHAHARFHASLLFTALESGFFLRLPKPMHVSKPRLFFMHFARSFPTVCLADARFQVPVLSCIVYSLFPTAPTPMHASRSRFFLCTVQSLFATVSNDHARFQAPFLMRSA